MGLTPALLQLRGGSRKTKLWGISILYHHGTAATATGVRSQAPTNGMISIGRFANTQHPFFPTGSWQEAEQLLMQFTGDGDCSRTSAWMMPRGQ